MGGDGTHIERAQAAISDAQATIDKLAPKVAPKTRVGRRADAAKRRVPPIKRWWLPVGILAVLFVGQVLAAVLVNDTTVGTVFAVGAVIVAVLVAAVAVLSYAREAEVPVTDIVTVLDEVLKGLDELKQAHEDAHGTQQPDKDATGADAKTKADGDAKTKADADAKTTEIGADAAK